MPNNSKQFIEKEALQIRQDYDFTNPEIDLFQLGQEIGLRYKLNPSKAMVFQVLLLEMEMIS